MLLKVQQDVKLSYLFNQWTHLPQNGESVALKALLKEISNVVIRRWIEYEKHCKTVLSSTRHAGTYLKSISWGDFALLLVKVTKWSWCQEVAVWFTTWLLHFDTQKHPIYSSCLMQELNISKSNSFSQLVKGKLLMQGLVSVKLKGCMSQQNVLYELCDKMSEYIEYGPLKFSLSNKESIFSVRLLI